VPIALALKLQLEDHRERTPGDLVFTGPTGAPIDYQNWRARVWAPLLEQAKVCGTFHMQRHFFVTALIQSGVNAKVAQTLAGHHSAAFTLDQHADAVPQREEAGERASTILAEASGSKTVAEPKMPESRGPQLIELECAPGEIRTPDPQVRSLMLYPTELRAHRSNMVA
jgi:Phage integrase family